VPDVPESEERAVSDQQENLPLIVGQRFVGGKEYGSTYRSQPSTPRQRLYLRCLMDELGLSSFEITLFHRKHFVAADLEFPSCGRRIDDVLTELTRDQASALVKVLEKEKSHAR
jgi:hypothetical protein